MRLQDGKRLFALFFMVGFLAGILFSNLASADYLQSVGMFHDYFLSRYTADDIRTGDFFWYVFWIRCLPVAVLFISSGSRLRRVVGALFLAWTGFEVGMVFTVAVMKLGARGIVLCLMAAFPHFLLYFAGYFLLLWQMFHAAAGMDFQKAAAILVLFAAGMVLECLVNPVIMQFVIQS